MTLNFETDPEHMTDLVIYSKNRSVFLDTIFIIMLALELN